MASDLDLLGQYARDNSQDAFTEIVRRHLDLVYSAALRQVRLPQLAEEVAQSVFSDLARVAATPSSPLCNRDDPPVKSLAPWLYAVTRRTAIDVIRKESRRRLREQIAVEMNNMNATANSGTGVPPVWSEIELLLDDAMAALDETDRSAVLLRYFENKSLREVGEALGASEDAAQKRVSRAVERLREFFSKRNVTIGASGLAVLISANAVQAAPIGLASIVSAAALLAGTAIHTPTAIAITKTIAMTTLQKTLVTATVAVLAGTGIYEARQAAQLRAQNQTLQQQQTPLAGQIQQLQRERDDATNRLASLADEIARLKRNPTELLKLRGEVARLQNTANDPAESAVKETLAKVNLLKQRLEQTPGAKIPEFQFLTEQDWLNATKDNLNTDDDYRRAFSALRNAAEQNFRPMIQSALRQYIQGNNGQFPADLSQLQQYFNPPVDAAILQRWQILPAADFPNTSVGADWVVTQKAAVDDEYDECLVLGPDGGGGFNSGFEESLRKLVPVLQEYSAANNGQTFRLTDQTGLIDLSPLKPYIQTPEQQAAFQKLLQLQKRYIEGK